MTEPGASSAERSESDDWASVAPYFEKVLTAARPFLGAIQAYAKETNDPVERRRLMSLADDLASERSADDVFDHGRDIDPAKIEALNWGSRRSQDEKSVNQILIRSQGSVNAANRTLWWTIGYPIIAILCMAAFGLLLWNLVVPQFKAIFDDFQLRLPAPTEFLLGLRPTLVFIMFACACVLAVWTFRRLLFGSRMRRNIAFRVPLVGYIYRNAAFGKLCHITSILIRQGAPLNLALRVAGRATLPNHLAESADRLDATGAELGPPGNSGSTSGFPRRLVLAIQTPLDDNDRGQLLGELAEDFYLRASHGFKIYWEPFVVVFLGFAVGFAFISLFMPLVSLITNLSG